MPPPCAGAGCRRQPRAFEAARARAAEANRVDAESELRGQPKALPANDYLAMRAAYWAHPWTPTFFVCMRCLIFLLFSC